MRASWIVIMALGCGNPTPPTVFDRPSPVPLPTPTDEVPWERVGEQADVTVLSRGESRDSPGGYEVYALAADRLTGVDHPALCQFLDALCVDQPPVETPVSPHAQLAPFRSTWLGNTAELGPFELGFVVDRERDFGGYRDRDLDGGVAPTLGLHLTRGEWGVVDAPGVVDRPIPLSGLSPDPREAVDLGGRRFQAFTWDPGPGELYVSVRGSGFDEVRRLLDDGRVEVDLEGLQGPVEVALWRIRSQTSVVAGSHEVVGRAVSQQAWCVTHACEQAPFPVFPAEIPFSFCWSPTNCGTSRWTFHADGRWDAPGSFGGSWSWDCCRQEIEIQFASGTVYWGRVDGDGCVDGEMRSWSGNLGEWSGCLY